MDNKNVYILEVEYNSVGVFQNKNSAIVAGISYMLNNWRDEEDESNEKQLLESIQSLIEEDVVEDYVAVIEVPYHIDHTDLS